MPKIHFFSTLLVKAIVGSNWSNSQQLKFVEFTTNYETGEEFNTHNIPMPLPFPPTPTAVRTQVPKVTELRELYQLHLFVMHKHNVPSRKILYKPGKALVWLIEHGYIKCYDTQVQRGWLGYNKKEDYYYPTLKGAYLMVWGMLPPFIMLRTAALESRASRILDEFNRARQEGVEYLSLPSGESLSWARPGQRETPNTSIAAPAAPETGIRRKRPKKSSG